MAHPLPRWKEKVHTFNGERPHRGFRQRLLEKVNCRTACPLTAAMLLHGSRCRTALRKAPSHSRMTDAACSSPRYGWCRRFVSIVHTDPQLIACIACHVGRCFPRETSSRALQPSSAGERHHKKKDDRILPAIALSVVGRRIELLLRD